MTRYAPLWQQNSTYPAAVDRGLLSTLWPASGSTGGAATTVNNTMNVSVAAGTAAVALASSAGSVLCRWDAAEVVTLTAAPPSGSSRIDLVVLQVRDAVLDAGSNNDFIFQAIAGTVGTPGPGAVPAVPTNAYAVAQVLVAGGVANLNGATVTDRRTAFLGRDAAAVVARGAVYSYPNGTAGVPLPFDTVQSDPMGMWRPASNAFVIPRTGPYILTGGFFAVATAIGQTLAASVYRNAAGYAVLGQMTSGAALSMQFAGATVRALTAGDSITFCAYTVPGLSSTYADPTTTWAGVASLG